MQRFREFRVHGFNTCKVNNVCSVLYNIHCLWTFKVQNDQYIFFDILLSENPIFKIFEPGLHPCALTKQPFVAALGIGNTVAYQGVASPQSLKMLLIFLCSELLQNNKKWPGTVYSRQYYSNN